MTDDEFTGSAVVFQATVTFGMKTRRACDRNAVRLGSAFRLRPRAGIFISQRQSA